MTNPCDIGGWSSSGVTPGAKRARLIGMFENIGRAATSCESKFAPDETRRRVDHGRSRRHGDRFGDLADFEREGQGHLLADGQLTPDRVDVLKPGISTVTS